MRALLVPCLAFCSLWLSGCEVVYSVDSLNNKEDAVEEPAITGTWSPGENSTDRLCIEKSDGNTYNMVITSSDSDSVDDSKSAKKPQEVVVYQLTLVRLDDQLFADMVFKEQALNGTKIEPPAGTIFHHVIVKLNLTDTDLGYSVLDDYAIREAKEQGYAPLSYVEVSDGILLIASTEDLRWSVSHYADRLFKDWDHFRRVSYNGADGSPQKPCNAIQSP